jgi:uncharacterized protein (TIGR02145 family)
MNILYTPKLNLLTPIKYGALYNWPAASKNGGSGVGSIAPIGCHVPSKTEWEILFTGLGGYDIGAVKLKESGLTYWNPTNTGTNEVGFNGRGAGFRDYYYTPYFNNILNSGSFKSITEYGSAFAYGAGLRVDNTGYVGTTPMKNGHSIRCLLNAPETWYAGMTVTDIDGNIYGTTKIGNQVWLTGNIAVTKFNDGTLIPNVTDNTAWAALTTPGYCWYNNDINNK